VHCLCRAAGAAAAQPSGGLHRDTAPWHPSEITPAGPRPLHRLAHLDEGGTVITLGVDVKVIPTPPCIFCMENH
jgi:hypothetical protein